jgi:hypothetical protein
VAGVTTSTISVPTRRRCLTKLKGAKTSNRRSAATGSLSRPQVREAALAELKSAGLHAQPFRRWRLVWTVWLNSHATSHVNGDYQLAFVDASTGKYIYIIGRDTI